MRLDFYTPYHDAVMLMADPDSVQKYFAVATESVFRAFCYATFAIASRLLSRAGLHIVDINLNYCLR